MASPNDLCLCRHPRKDHCKGNVFHANYKDSMRQMSRPLGANCSSAHCESVLCCCIAFRLAPETV